MTKLILVRHGETNKNIHNILHTVNDNETLNKTGIKQIKSLAHQLGSYSPTKIYTSSEQRTKDSAKLIAAYLNISLEEIHGIQERNWGIFSGKTWEEVEILLNTMTLTERYNYIPQNGESWKVFATRLVAAIKKIVKNNSEKTVIVMTHGGVIRALMPFFLALPKEESFKYNPKNASFTIIDL